MLRGRGHAAAADGIPASVVKPLHTPSEVRYIEKNLTYTTQILCMRAGREGEVVMDKVELSNTHEKLSQLQGTEVTAVTALPFELLNRRNNKSTKLLANSGDTAPMNGAHRWFDYEFSEPVFLCELEIFMENYNAYDTFDIKYKLAQGGEVTQDTSRESDTVYRTSINQLVRSVSFKPPKKWFTNTKINSVSLTGFKPEELEDFIRLVGRLDKFKAEIIADSERALRNAEEANHKTEQLRRERDELLSTIGELKGSVTELNNQIGRLTEERNGLVADVKTREESVASLEEQEVTIKERINARNAERSAMATEIGEMKQELRSLQDDINMFPTEISGFVSQAAQNTRSYWRLSWIPIFLLVTMAALLVFNAANLTTVVDEYENARIFSILATRIPYVVIATAIIGAAYKLAALFVGEIMRINQQRLNLSKVSIIATDVSKASEEGLENLSDEEIYALRTRLKMDMLRDHMKEYLSKNFIPSLVREKHTGVADIEEQKFDKADEEERVDPNTDQTA